jgi:hypothetical protein
MDLRVLGCGMDRTELAVDRDQRTALANTVINFRVP